MRVTFYTLGCKVNQNETGALAQLFEENGYTVVSNEEPADVYVVNSCTVTNFGDQKSRKWLRRVYFPTISARQRRPSQAPSITFTMSPVLWPGALTSTGRYCLV